MISKNSRASRKRLVTRRMLDGKEVIPVKYWGKGAGHGIYMSGTLDNSSEVPALVKDRNGKPLPLKAIGKIEKVYI